MEAPASESEDDSSLALVTVTCGIVLIGGFSMLNEGEGVDGLVDAIESVSVWVEVVGPVHPLFNCSSEIASSMLEGGIYLAKHRYLIWLIAELTESRMLIRLDAASATPPPAWQSPGSVGFARLL